MTSIIHVPKLPMRNLREEEVEKSSEDFREKKSNMCCTPYITTGIAAVLSFLQAVAGLCWNVPVLLNITWNKTDVSALISLNLKDMDNMYGVYGTALIFAFLNCQLLVFALLLLKSNADSKTEWMRGWCSLIMLRSGVEFILGFYYFSKYCAPVDINTETNYRLAVLSSGVYFIWPLINSVFAAIVFKRSLDLALYNEALVRAGKLAQERGLLPPPPYQGDNNSLGDESRDEEPVPVSLWADMRLLESPLMHDPFF